MINFRLLLNFLIFASLSGATDAWAWDMSCVGKNRQGEPRMIVIKKFADFTKAYKIYLISKNPDTDQFEEILFERDMKVLSRLDQDSKGNSRILNLKKENKTFEFTEDAPTELGLTMRLKMDSSDEAEKAAFHTEATNCRLEIPEFKLKK